MKHVPGFIELCGKWKRYGKTHWKIHRPLISRFQKTLGQIKNNQVQRTQFLTWCKRWLLKWGLRDFQGSLRRFKRVPSEKGNNWLWCWCHPRVTQLQNLTIFSSVSYTIKQRNTHTQKKQNSNQIGNPWTSSSRVV